MLRWAASHSVREKDVTMLLLRYHQYARDASWLAASRTHSQIATAPEKKKKKKVWGSSRAWESR